MSKVSSDCNYTYILDLTIIILYPIQ